MTDAVESPACDAIERADHPTPEDGGPCAGCAFRPGTEAHGTPHTRLLARLCVEGFRHFNCHERPGLCRGWVAAMNLRGVPQGAEENERAEMLGMAADALADAIAAGATADAERVEAQG